MKHLILLIFLLSQLHTSAQNNLTNYNFNYLIIEVNGDLNKDNLPDKVIVTQDTLNDYAPYRLQIFLQEPDGEFKLFVTSTQLIEPQFPNGRDGYRNGTGFSDVTIIKGVLSVNVELIRGHFEHKFRFQNGNFELIGFSEVYSNGLGTIDIVDFNLSTGIRIEISQNYSTDKIISNKKKKILIRPLPKLEDVVPFDKDLY